MRLSVFYIKAATVGSLIVSPFAVLANYSPAFAQMGLSPLFFEEQAERGRSQGVLTLTNGTERPVRARVYAEPFTYGRDGFVSLREDAADLSPYLQFSPREVVIPPGAEQRVRVLSLFPPGFPAGEYRAAIFAEELVESAAQTGAVAVNVRVGSTLYVHQGDLSAVLAGQSATVAADGRSLDVLVNNQGQASARASLSWQLVKDAEQAAGQIFAAGELNEHTVATGGDRLFSIGLPEALPAGSYRLKGEMRWTTRGEAYSQLFELPVTAP